MQVSFTTPPRRDASPDPYVGRNYGGYEVKELAEMKESSSGWCYLYKVECKRCGKPRTVRSSNFAQLRDCKDCMTEDEKQAKREAKSAKQRAASTQIHSQRSKWQEAVLNFTEAQHALMREMLRGRKLPPTGSAEWSHLMGDTVALVLSETDPEASAEWFKPGRPIVQCSSSTAVAMSHGEQNEGEDEL